MNAGEEQVEREESGTFENMTAGLIGGGDDTGESAFRVTVSSTLNLTSPINIVSTA